MNEALASIPRFSLLDVQVHAVTSDQVRSLVAQAVRYEGSVIIGHHNLNSVYLCRRSRSMRRFYEAADLVYIDGMPLVVLGRLLGYPLAREHRITSLDWFPELLRESAKKGWGIFYLGSRPGVAELGAERLRARFPGLTIHTHHGYFDMDDPQENGRVLEEISRFLPNVLLVGMGMPRQEEWILRNLDAISANVTFTIGALMDYHADEIPVPPRWMGRIGLEWAFRLVAEPRRLGRRYLVDPWALVGPFLRDLWRIRARRSPTRDPLTWKPPGDR